MSKLINLKDAASSGRWDIICVTETHLLSLIPDSFAAIPDYILFRHDTTGPTAKHGVCIYVHKLIMADSFTKPLPNVISVHLPAFDVYFLLVYRPPSNPPVANDSVLNLISEFCVGKEVILVGDFNLPSIDWHTNPPKSSSAMDASFLDCFNSLGLTQWVHEPTYPRSGNILDLVLTSESDRIGLVKVLSPFPGCDHCPTMFEYAFVADHSQESYSSQASPHKHWHKGNYGAITHHLASLDWNFELAYLSADEAFKHFATILHCLVEQFVPVKPKQEKKAPWLKRPPTSLINHRQAAWQSYKQARQQFGRHSAKSSDSYASFQYWNRRYRSFTVSCQADYEENILLHSKDNPKLLHSYIRTKKVGALSVGPIRLDSGQLTDKPGVMAEVFASSFASVYTRHCPNRPFPHQSFDGSIGPISFPVSHVLKALQSLDGNTAMGPDQLHPLLLKSCATQLAYPLHIIFTRILVEGQLPHDWKSSMVFPIFKKGARFNPLNYRPISLTSVCCKTFERLLCGHLTNYLESNMILSPHQFGFRASRSTVDQLLLVYDNVSKHMDEGHIVDVILFDFSKAFDVVVHSLLINKLKSLGIRGKILQCIHSFLSDRSMRVCIDGHLSQEREVLSGVPQGSVLGPLLFLIYINSIGSNLSSSFKIFADDLKLYACVSYPNRSLPAPPSSSIIQSDIDRLSSTAASWGLHMNVKKCQVLRFSRSFPNLVPPAYTLDGTPIPSVDSASDLGVLVDTSLKFHNHIRSLAHKANGLAYSLLKSTVCRSPQFMIFLLTTHIRPLIEYCSCVWNTGYIQDIKLLESIQRRWTKCISGLETLSYSDRLKTLNLYSVQGRLLRADLIQYWKIFNGKSCIVPLDLFVLPPQNRTRGHGHKIFSSASITDIRRRSFSQRCISTWNSLPVATVFAQDILTFKRWLHRDLNDELYSYV